MRCKAVCLSAHTYMPASPRVAHEAVPFFHMQVRLSLQMAHDKPSLMTVNSPTQSLKSVPFFCYQIGAGPFGGWPYPIPVRCYTRELEFNSHGAASEQAHWVILVTIQRISCEISGGTT